MISATEPAKIDETGLTFEVKIDRARRVDDRARRRRPPTPAGATSWLRPRPCVGTTWRAASSKWVERAPRLECDSDSLRATYHRSLVDLAALRFSTRTIAGALSLPAAGLPWFMTMFGRDSIFTSLQALPFTPELAATTLRALGERQGTRVDDFRDEDPGRILHEMRYGEMTAFEERPHSPYYGCADATPLFVVLLDEYERWTGDTKLVRDLEFEARAALNWIDEYAEPPGQRLRRRTSAATRRPASRTSAGRTPGTRSPTATARCPGFPRATCELQGYAYDAKMRGARLARAVWNDPAFADRLEKEAADLKRRFNRDFWVEDERVLRARARRRRPPGRRADLEQRAPAVERHRRQVQGQGGRRAT